MKIVFIRTTVYDKEYDSFKPLVFPIIAALTPKDIEIQFIDEQVEKLPDSIDADIIAFSVLTYTAKKSYILAKKYKTDKNIIVMGGFHPSVLPEESLKYSDCVFVGDAEDTWPQFLDDYKNGCLKDIYYSQNKAVPMKIDYNFPYFKGKKYPNVGVVSFSRGCKFNCDFCSIKSMYKKGVRFKSIDTVIEEIKQIPEKIFFFIDDNLFVNEEVALELFSKMKKLKKLWGCQISIDVAKNHKILKAMREAGCLIALIGFESINKDNLKQMNKGANKLLKDYDESIKNVYSHGIMICATFVFGYDFDMKESVRQTLEFALKYGFMKCNFNMLVPMPGTSLYSRLEKEDRLIMEKWWINDHYKHGDPVFVPKMVGPIELRDACEEVWKEYYSTKNILKRFFQHFKRLSFIRGIAFLGENFFTKIQLKGRNSQKVLGGILGEDLKVKY